MLRYTSPTPAFPPLWFLHLTLVLCLQQEVLGSLLPEGGESMLFFALVDLSMPTLLSISKNEQAVHSLPAEDSPKTCTKLPCAGNVAFDRTQDCICYFFKLHQSGSSVTS